MQSPKQALQARGIERQAELAGWGESQYAKYPNYWMYPIFNLQGEKIGERGKSYPNQDQPKYIWPNGKPKDPASDYYVLSGTLGAIKEANGVAYLANGEASVLAMREAGIFNVFATCHGESTVPKTLLEQLKAMGVTKLINIADKDAAGTKAAAKWRDGLRDSDAEYQAKQWPEYLPDKADFNDLWIAVNFDSYAARIALENCQALILPQSEIKRQIPISTDVSSTPEGLIELIANTLRGMGWKQSGEWINGLSLFRDEHKPSAGLNLKSGVYHDFTGDSVSPAKIAEHLGIDWKRFYPEKVAAKPKKSKPVHQTVTVIESVTAPEGDDDFITMGGNGFSEIVPMADYGANVFASYQKRGWIDQDELPVSWVRAFLHLTHSKSATSVYAIRLHQAFRSGALNQDAFTISDVMNYLDSPRPSTQAALDFLTFCNCLMILDTKYLDTTIGVAQSLKNKKGRKAIVYAVNTNTEFIVDSIIGLLEPALLERLTEDEIAPINGTMRDSLDLDFAEWKAWHEKTTTPKQQYTLDLINRILCEVLESKASYQFSAYDLQSPAHLRAKLLNIELAPYSEERTITNKETGEITAIPKGIQLSRSKIALNLGCSLSAMSNLYELANVGSERKRGWYEVINPNGCDILKELREAPLNLNKELSGVALGANIQVDDNGNKRYLGLAYADRAVNLFNAWNGHILKLYIFVEQPSLLWNMSADEIAQKAAKEAQENQSALDSAESPEERAIVVEKIEKKAEKKARKPSFVNTGDRLYKGHKPAWVAEKLGLYVHVWTWHKLEGLAIVDKQNAVISSFKNHAEIITWLNRNAEAKQVRTVESYYNPQVLELESEAEAMPELPVQKPVIEAPKQAPKQAPKPMAVVEKVKYSPAPIPIGNNWTWVDNDALFRERMLAIGAKL